jgi:hypothetical protein
MNLNDMCEVLFQYNVSFNLIWPFLIIEYVLYLDL